jgi:2'-5' RNA ligase
MADAQPDFSDGSMVALYPPADLARELAIPGGLPVDELHCTIAYTGDAVDIDAGALTDAVHAVAGRDPITATISGHARFTGGDKGDVVVALVDSADIEDLRQAVVAALADRGIDIPRDHGFTAHITLAYVPAAEDCPVERLDARPAVFASVAAVHGNDCVQVSFTTPDQMESAARQAIVPYARTAFAQGWAMSGGPMTDRVKAGCVAAVEHACAHADDPDVLEATLRLGHLEGTWAKVYQRRDKLLADTTATVTETWHSMIDQVDVGAVVRWYRALEGLTTEARTDDPELVRATDTARVLLHALPETTGWAEIRQQLRDGIVAAQTEGSVGALAIAADSLNLPGFNFDTAYDHFHTALTQLESTWTDADAWLGRMVNGSAGDLGRRLAALVRADASYEDMVAGALDVLGSTDVRAVSTVVDLAVHQSLTTGAMNLWAREGVQQVDFYTAGDSRVCAACEKAEANGPYDLTADPPRPPLHPLCRCTLTARNPISLATLQPFLEVVT